MPESRVQNLVSSGEAKNLEDVARLCQAGEGPCRGSCRPRILQVLEKHKTTGAAAETSVLPQDFLKAISLFNRRYYWETHEVLEDLWREESGDLKTFYQGIIQASAALYHVLNANPKGCLKLAEDSLAKLSRFAAKNPWGVPVHDLNEALRLYIQQSRRILAREISGFDYDALPQIVLPDRLNLQE